MHKKVKERFLSLNKLQRNHLAGITIVLFLLNILLTIKVFNQDNLVVLVPNSMGTVYNTNNNQESNNKYNTFSISTTKVSNEYLEAITRDVITTLLNITPNNIQYAANSILNMVHPSSYGEIKSYLYQVMEDIQKRKITTVFFPITIQTSNKDTGNLKSIVEGDLVTYLGKEEVSRSRNKYQIGFNYNGKLTVTEFSEINNKEVVNVQN
ncbi:TraE/TraK family type IV conjugative transfer system protein [Pseudomonadota bacterium]